MTVLLGLIRQLVDITIIISPLLPLLVALTRYVGKKTKNQNIINLATRSDIIVRSLDRFPLELENIEKRNMAVTKLSEYANEVGIKLTPEQAGDYIESTVELLRKEEQTIG